MGSKVGRKVLPNPKHNQSGELAQGKLLMRNLGRVWGFLLFQQAVFQHTNMRIGRYMVRRAD